MQNKGSLFILSAPSGAGKTSLVKELMKEMPGVLVSVSYTTRAIRPREKEGVDYHFVSHDGFNKMLQEGVFLEHAQVFGQYYGTSKVWVENARLQGIDVILEIDWQGARQIRIQFEEAQSIFILPPSRQALEERLHKRHQENVNIVLERMHEAKDQISHYSEYDYLICNDRFEEALEDLKSIVRCHRLNWRRQRAQQEALINQLTS
jgi:guanylate kinase